MDKTKVFTGQAWIGDKFCSVTFIRAKDCDFKKENYLKVLQKDDPGIKIDSEVCETYMRYNVGHSEEYGDGFYEGAPRGTRGASLYYYAKTKFVDIEAVAP